MMSMNLNRLQFIIRCLEAKNVGKHLVLHYYYICAGHKRLAEVVYGRNIATVCFFFVGDGQSFLVLVAFVMIFIA